MDDEHLQDMDALLSQVMMQWAALLKESRDFPDDPLVKTASQCRGHGFNP